MGPDSLHHFPRDNSQLGHFREPIRLPRFLLRFLLHVGSHYGEVSRRPSVSEIAVSPDLILGPQEREKKRQAQMPSDPGPSPIVDDYQGAQLLDRRSTTTDGRSRICTVAEFWGVGVRLRWVETLNALVQGSSAGEPWVWGWEASDVQGTEYSFLPAFSHYNVSESGLGILDGAMWLIPSPPAEAHEVTITFGDEGEGQGRLIIRLPNQ